MALNKWLLSAVVVLVVGGTTAVRADEPVATTSRSAEIERLERDHRAKLTKERESRQRFASGARNGLIGLALLVIVPAGMSIFTWSKRRSRRVTIPMTRVRRLPRACVVTGSTEDLERETITYKYTSGLSTAVGLLSLISLYTGGIIYRPGSRSLDLKLPLSDEGRRLAAEGQRLLILSQMSRILLVAGFFAAAIFVKIQLLWVLPLVLAMTVPALLAEKAASRSTPTCLSMTDDVIHLEFAQQDVADAVREAVGA